MFDNLSDRLSGIFTKLRGKGKLTDADIDATARTHVSRAMVKLGARDRAQLVVFAYQSGLVAS